MKSLLLAVVLVLICGAQSARAQGEPVAPACEFRQEPLPAPAAATTTGTAAKITLLGLDPPEGGDVSKTTIIGVDLEYSVEKFEPDKLTLLPKFPTSSQGSMAPGDRKDYPYLKSAAGRVHLCVPLAEVYDYQSVHWPLSMSVSINLETDPNGSSRVLADSRSVKFNALDIPAGALERQAAEPPIEYQDALGKAFAYIEIRSALYKVCIQHYPELQIPFTKAYRRWEARHAEDIKLLNERQFDRIKRMVRNDARAAAQIFDATRDASIKSYQQLDDQRRRSSCKFMLEDLQDPDDLTDDAIGDELAIVRAWHPPEPKP